MNSGYKDKRMFSVSKRANSISNKSIGDYSNYKHPLSRILKKADSILEKGMKYSTNYVKKIPKHSGIKMTGTAWGAISFDSLLKNHSQKRESWLSKLQNKNRSKLNESFKDLDSIQSDEIEKEVPVQTETDKKIIGLDAENLSWLNSDLKENRIKIFPESSLMSTIQPSLQNQPEVKEPKPNLQRENMMKEVNDMIDELQIMLKPKKARKEIDKENLSVVINNPKDTNLNACVKDLWKTDFWSETFSLNSFRDNYATHEPIRSEYNEEIEATISQMGSISNQEFWSVKGNSKDLNIFETKKPEIHVLGDRTNQNN